jgi:hypothetical protein
MAGERIQIVVYIVLVVFVAGVAQYLAVMLNPVKEAALQHDTSALNGNAAVGGIHEALVLWVPLIAMLGAIAIGFVKLYQMQRVSGRRRL